ncbi:MAG: DUF4260 domain-containing protein [Proteobacteria bacterium]|nr:DUF4260 domain-containing protein [Pseudomonadota bacterium]
MSGEDIVPGFAAGPIRVLLRTEGLVLFVVALALYEKVYPDWWLFLYLILVPDVSMFGYLAGPRFGALCYNTAHSTIGPLITAGFGLMTGWALLTGIGLIWAAHVGIDRALGYGLKYPTAFRDTHLGRIGRLTEKPA